VVAGSRALAPESRPGHLGRRGRCRPARPSWVASGPSDRGRASPGRRPWDLTSSTAHPGGRRQPLSGQRFGADTARAGQSQPTMRSAVVQPTPSHRAATAALPTGSAREVPAPARRSPDQVGRRPTATRAGAAKCRTVGPRCRGPDPDALRSGWGPPKAGRPPVPGSRWPPGPPVAAARRSSRSRTPPGSRSR
jgi:hypothetical protein